MSFRSKLYTLVLLLPMVVACEDLNPSSSDRRPLVDVGVTGSGVGQTAPDFALLDTQSGTVQLVTELASPGTAGIVLYFTMWCPVCDSHMSHMRANIMPDYPQVSFYFVDYVSGTVANARAAQLANGYADVDVLVDDNQQVRVLYDATMGTTVVIAGDATVLMNEDYKDGSRLDAILNTLP